MTPDVEEIFNRTQVMLRNRKATEGDTLLLAAMYVSFARKMVLRAAPDTPIGDIEHDLLALSYAVDAHVEQEQAQTAQ